MRKKFRKMNEKYLLVNENEMIAINFYEDELEQEFYKKKASQLEDVPKNAIPIFIDVNLEKEEMAENLYKYNPISHIKNDDEVFEIAELILRESNNHAPGCKLLLCTLIFYVIKFRPIEEQNLESISELARMSYSPCSYDEEISGLDFLLNLLVSENPKSIVTKLYSGFKSLTKEKQDEIAVLLFETLLPFRLGKYDKFNEDKITELKLLPNEYPCYMLYLNDYEECVQDRILAEIFALQHKKISKE